ncbi:MAG: GPP34 family phosphoprotein [Microbacterium sp.]|uniref:GOLPH3/VPS74 family protein n=1 Tax=Microbacterium sp. TaxID=51671 RepID=UPI0039E5D8C6
MLTSEEMYLLLTRANGDPEVAGAPAYFLGHGLTSGLTTDLVVAERVAVTVEPPARVHVLSTAPTGLLVLDWGLERIGDRDGRTLESTLRWGRFNPELAVVESLVQAGVLERGKRKLMGFGMQRAIQTSPEPKQRIRDRLAGVFAGDTAPTAQDASILAALKSLGAAALLLGPISGAADPVELDERIEALVAASPLPGGAVARGILEIAPLAPHHGSSANSTGTAGGSAGVVGF